MVLRPLNVLRVTLAVLLVALPARAAKTKGGYVVVVSSATFAKADWRKVADALEAKHGAIVCQYKTSPSEALPALKKHFPKYACFLATPGEAGRKFVAEVHQLTRKLDDDPYTDLLWGVLTGYDAPTLGAACIGAGARDYLPKSRLTPERLREAVLKGVGRMRDKAGS